MGTRGGSGQELYRQIAKKGREAAKERLAQVGTAGEKTNLQRESEQRGVNAGAQGASPTSARGATRVSGPSKGSKKNRV